MMPNFNPKQMQKMMAQMGIDSKDIDAKRVIIECADKKIIIEQPSVTQINMQGQKSFQIAGNVKEEAGAGSQEGEDDKKQLEDDIKIIMSQANVTRTEAEAALKDSNNDLAEAIMKLQNK